MRGWRARAFALGLIVAAGLSGIVGTAPAEAAGSKCERCLAAAAKAVGHRIDTRRYRIVLSTDGADRFAGSKGTKFEGVEWVDAPGGSPLLSGVLAWVECDVERDVEAGDHTIFIGRVTAAEIQSARESPLVHFGGRYHTVAGLDE